MKRRNAVLLLLLFTSFIQCATAQEQESFPFTKKLLNERGWNFPGSEWVKRHKPFNTSKTTVAEREVTVQSYKAPLGQLQENPAVYLPTVRIQNGVGTFKKLRLVAVQVQAYSISKRFFCYDVTSVPYDCNEKGDCGYSGAGIEIRFCDMDGDGLFETMTHASRSILKLELEIPNWVLERK